MEWNEMENNFSIFHTGKFLPFDCHSILKIFHSVFHTTVFFHIPFQTSMLKKFKTGSNATYILHHCNVSNHSWMCDVVRVTIQRCNNGICIHNAHGLIQMRSQDLGFAGPNQTPHGMTSEIFKKRAFLSEKEWKIRSRGTGLARYKDFAKGKWIKQLVKKFYKYIKIGRRGKLITATQTFHRRGLGVDSPAAGGYGIWKQRPRLPGNFL